MQTLILKNKKYNINTYDREYRDLGLHLFMFKPNEQQVFQVVYQRYRKEFFALKTNGKLVSTKDGSYREKSGFFKLWMTKRFPFVANPFLRGTTYRSNYDWLAEFPLKQVVQYLPIFILRRLEEYLEDGDKFSIVQHLMEGNNVRSFVENPYPMTKKMAHIFSQFTNRDNLDVVYYKSFVFGNGGNENLYNSINTFWSNLSNDIDLIEMVVLFFRKYPDLRAEEFRLLFGYINHMIHEVDGYDLKGRTISSLRRASTAYYEEMNRLEEHRQLSHYAPEELFWKGAKYNNWSDDDGHVIIQLTSAQELIKESANMHHCVRTYARKCARGNCSIWSLRFMDDEGTATRFVTIEVSSSRLIIQAKAEFNQRPSEAYMKMIEQWASKEGLNIAHYV